MKKHITYLLSAFLIVPVLLYAAPENLGALIEIFSSLIDPIIRLLAGLAVLYFMWGIVQYIKSAGDAEAARKGKSIMLYGILALFVLFSFWTIVQFIYKDIFGS